MNLERLPAALLWYCQFFANLPIHQVQQATYCLSTVSQRLSLEALIYGGLHL